MVKNKITKGLMSSLMILLLVASSFVVAPVRAVDDEGTANLITENDKTNDQALEGNNNDSSNDNLVDNEPAEVMQVVATKVWVGGSAPRPTVYFKLFRNILGQTPQALDVEVLPVVSGSATEVSVSWDNLPKLDGTGVPYIYTVREYVNVSDDPGELTLIYGAPFNYLKNESGLRVINTLRETPAASNKTFVQVEKTWNNVTPGQFPTASFSLYDKKHPDQVITGLITYPNTTYMFNELPAYTSGANPELIEYIVEEQPLANYTQLPMVKTDIAILDVNRVTPNNIMDPSLGYNPSFVVTKPTGGQPYIIWTLNYVPIAQRADFIASFIAAAARDGVGLGPFDNMSASDPINWINGPDVNWDVYPSDPGSGMIHIEILYNEDGTIADNSVIDFQNHKTWTQFVVGSHSALLYEVTNIYSTFGTMVPKIKKNLVGRSLAAGEFYFQLFKNGTPIGVAVANDAAGNVVFPQVIFNSSDVGSHTYIVREVVGTLGGITYSSEEIVLNATVTTKKDGSIVATYTYQNQKDTITNYYHASGSIALSVHKELNGRALAANEFTFGLYSGDVLLASATNDASGNIVFSALNFTLDDVGTRVYTLKEMSGSLGGITYSTEIITATVSISDKGDGSLNIVATYNEENPTFTNTYAATGSTDIFIFKDLRGRTLLAGEFTFDLYEGSTLLDTATNNASGLVQFATLHYDLEDVGDKTYTVKERIGTINGITYSTEEIVINMGIVDSGNGTLIAGYTYQLNNDTITNVYNSSGSFVPTATKELAAGNRNLAANEFEFALKDASGTVLQTAFNRATGLIVFDAITFEESDAGKVFNYTIEEIGGTEVGMSYDPMVIRFSVSVVDNNDGTLSLSVNYPQDVIFNNSYRAHGSWTPSVTKTLTGRDLVLNEFEFKLYKDGVLISTGYNGLDGTVLFDTIFYTEEDINRVYTYTIEEVNTGLGGITYDSSIKTVIVTVNDDLNGILTIDADYSNTVFENAYRAQGGFSPRVTKTLVAGNRALRSGEFSFSLKDSEGNLIQTVSNSASGLVVFNELTFDETDIGMTYTYTVTENIGTELGMTYDPKVFTFSVTVNDLGNGLLAMEIENSDAGIFTNTYTATGTFVPSITKVLVGRALNAGEFNFGLYVGDLMIAQASNAVDGSVVFTGIEFTEADIGETFTYSIKELSGTLGGVTYSDEIINVVVEVSDLGDGVLGVLATYSETNPTITNSYEAFGSTAITIHKTLIGRALKAGEFTFDLYEGSTFVSSATNNGSGLVEFDVLYFDLDDLGNKTYRVVERAGAPGAITYSDEELIIYLVVMDDGNGSLNTVITHAGNDNTITNVYQASGGFAPSAIKVLDGGNRGLEAGAFSFALKDAEGNLIQTVTNSATGQILFDTITYDEMDAGKVFTYTIEEILGTEVGMDYDDMVINISVNVIDKGDGTLEVQVTYPSDTVFNNTYRANAAWTPTVTKLLSGRSLVLNEFEFELYQDDVLISTGFNGLDGTVLFDSISYTEADIGETYTYTIKELNNEKGGITYDTTVKTITVSIADGHNGELDLDITYSSSTFENTYHASGVFTPKVTKVFVGGNRKMLAGEFVFELRKDGVVLQEALNDEHGNVIFETIMFNEADVDGTHIYTVNEKAGTEVGMTYDSHTVQISVIVSDMGYGLLNISADYSGGSVFTNTYKASGDFVPQVTKVLEGRDLVEGEFSFALRKNNQTLGIAANDAVGNIVFETITYDENDIGNTYVYTIHELIGTLGGISYDEAILSISVSITDGLNGSLSISAQYSGTTFTNTYHSDPVEVVLDGQKTLAGRDLNAGEFVFELYAANSDYVIMGEALATVTNKADGTFDFESLVFEQGMEGIYYYVVIEKAGSLGGIDYDDTISKLYITVTDDLKGQMKAEVAFVGNTILFENYYRTQPVLVSIEAVKTLLGRKLWDGEFTFELLNEDGIVMATANNIAGKINFDLNFSEPGVYTYKMREVKGILPYIVYDESVYDIEITITDNLEGNLVATVVHDDIYFENHYITNPKLDITKSAKLVNGKPLYTKVGEVIEYTITATNTGDITLLSVLITDEHVGLYGHRYMIIHLDESVTYDVTNGEATLLPGEKLVMVANYTITQEDLNNRNVNNVANAKGYEPSPEDPGEPRNDTPTVPDKPAEADVPGRPDEILPPTGVGMTNPMLPFMLIGLGLYLVLKRKKEA